MKNILILAINSKFVHTNLAIRYIKKYVEHNSDIKINMLEKTINNSLNEIISAVYRKNPDILLISTYIWNREYVFKVIREIKKIDKNIEIILGGPEVSYEAQKIMEEYQEIDIIIKGEGEETALELFEIKDKSEIKGIYYRDKKDIIFTGDRQPICDLDKIPFPYTDEELKEPAKIFYYESSRGCPFDCSYCMSSIDKRVRYFSLERAKKDLKIFMDAGVGLVKFVDRTYNLKKERYMELWTFLLENYRENLTFHFEISADLFDEEAINFLKNVPDGYFQFEVGVQTINGETLELINRRNHLEKLKKNILSIKGNIHLHLDLIVGLPKEDYSTFRHSFDYVYGLGPEMIQMGFLKILQGTQISTEIDKYGYKYLSCPPYEILSNNYLNYGEILLLKDIEHMLDYYYNSEKFKESTKYIIEKFYEGPFDFYEDLALYYREKEFMEIGHKQLTLFDNLYEFYICKGYPDIDIFENILKYDYFIMEKPKKEPYWTNRKTDKELYNILAEKVEGRSMREKYKHCELEFFDYNIKTNRREETKLFFVYRKKTNVEEI
jgi:radical SAM superfamily enzyme YgiQ (UPF0313 family)